MAAGSLRELFISLGVDGDTKGLEHFERKAEGIFARLKAGAEVVVETLAFKEIGEFFSKIIEGAGHVHDLSEKLDVSATFLESFGLVAKQSGVDFEESSAAIGHFNQHVGEAIIKGGEVAKTFAQLGIKIKQGGQARPVIDLLLDVSEALKKQPDQFHRAAYAQQLFGRSGRQILPVLAQGRVALAAMLDEANALGSGLGDQFYTDADTATDAIDRFKFGLHSLALRLAAEVLPFVTKTALALAKAVIPVITFTKHSNVLRTALLFLSGVIGLRLLASMRALGLALGVLRPGILGTVNAIMRLANTAKLIFLLYLVFDDLFTLITGGQSVIGDMIDKMYGVGASKQFVEQLKEAWTDLSKSFSGLSPVFASVISSFKDTIPGAIKYTVAALIEVAEYIDDVVTGVRELSAFAKHIGANWRQDKGASASSFDELDRLSAGQAGREAQRKALLATLFGAAPPVGYAAPPGQQPLSAAGPAAPGSSLNSESGNAAYAATHISNSIQVDVTTQSDQPQAVGAAVGQGVATEVEKAHNRALASQASP